MFPAIWSRLAPVLLLASLAANVFFVSTFAGLFMQGPQEQPVAFAGVPEAADSQAATQRGPEASGAADASNTADGAGQAGRPAKRERRGGWLSRLFDDLPPEQSKRAKEIFSRHREALREARSSIWDRRADVAMAIGAEPFAPDDFRSALEQSTEASDLRRRVFNAALQEVAEGLDEAGRAALAAALKQQLERRRSEAAERERQNQKSGEAPRDTPQN